MGKQCKEIDNAGAGKGRAASCVSAAAAVTIPALLALPVAAGAVTQAELDGALSCCWTGSPTGGSQYGWCYTNNACGQGQSTCYSKYFRELDMANDGYMSCGTMSFRGAENTLQGQRSGPPLFMAPRGVTVSEDVTRRLGVTTAVVRLQAMAAEDDELAALRASDMAAAFERIGASLPEGVSITIDNDESTGNEVVRVDGIGDTTEVLSFGADGKRLEDRAE